MAAVASTRGTVGWALLAAALTLAAALHFDAGPKLEGVLPEADGVHPVRAAQAFRVAYAPGGGFPDKYPPLGSFLMGVVVAVTDGAFLQDSAAIPGLPAAERRPLLWALRGRMARLIEAQRWVSRLAIVLSAALVAALVQGLARRAGARSLAAGVAALLAGCAFGMSYPALYYANTTNVDALALAASLVALCCCVQGRWLGAAVALGAATAIKDPAYALAPVVLAGAWWAPRGAPAACSTAAAGLRRLVLAAVGGLLAYALLAGAVTGPAIWWQHLLYLLGGGVSGVPAIDHAELAQWWQLGRYGTQLLAGALGWGGLFAGLAGLLIGFRAERRAAALLSGALVAPVLLFVAPVGFAYVRFLLVPLAVLGVGAGLLLALALSRAGSAGAQSAGTTAAGTTAAGTTAADGGARDGPVLVRTARAACLACLLVALMHDRGVLDYHHHVVPTADARVLAVRRLAALRAAPRAEDEQPGAAADASPGAAPDAAPGVARGVAPQGGVALIADEVEHGPPLDPAWGPLEIAGLDRAESCLSEWRARPHGQRPEFVLWMSFTNAAPSGAPVALPGAPAPGTRVGGMYEVLEAWGPGAREPAEQAPAPVRSLAVRPLVMLLRRLDS